jgi:hypothetical protein
MTNNEQIKTYKAAVAYAKQHIKDLENILEIKENKIESLIEREIEFRTDVLGQDEKITYRKVYREIYEDLEGGSRHKFLTKLPSKFLTQKEQEEWFDEASDRYITRGDHIANSDYEDLMNYELSTLPADLQPEDLDAYEYHDDIKKDYKVVEGNNV